MNGWNATPPGPAPTGQKFGKPNKIIPVPPEFRRVTLARERDVLVNDLKIKTDCDVFPHWEQGKIDRFNIHGSAAGVEKAVGYIHKWISNAHVKSKDSTAWAKLPAFNANQWYYDRVSEMEGDRKQMFKGPVPEIPPDAPSPPSTIVDWPEDLRNHPVTPRDVFGNKLEALNDLRMRDEVFITLLSNNNGLWQVEILGFDSMNVEVATEHYHTMIEKVRADIFGLQHPINIILDDKEGIDVVLEEAEQWWPNRADRIVPRLLSDSLMFEPGSFRREDLDSKQLAMVQHSFQQALEAVRRKKGSYDFAIRLGCLALGSQKMRNDQLGKTFHKEEFLKAINSRVHLAVKKWLLEEELGWEVLHKLVAAEHLLEPTKSAGYYGHLPASLEKTRPMFRGTWVFLDPNSSVPQPVAPIRHSGRPTHMQQNAPVPPAAAPPSSLLVVQIDWTDDEEGLYEKSDTRFYRLEPGKAAPKINMDINLLELGESRGWYFALESLTPVSQKLVSPVLTGFAKRVKMQPDYDVRSTTSFAHWDQTPTIQKHLQTGRLDKIYSFGIQKTCYKVELTAMWYPQQNTPVWGLAVRHTEWATHLAELERLSVGCQADWGNTLSTFLPDDGLSSYVSDKDDDLGMENLKLDDGEYPPPRDGIRILMEKLMQLSEIVSSVTATEGGIAV